jgi:hypothetical protein
MFWLWQNRGQTIDQIIFSKHSKNRLIMMKFEVPEGKIMVLHYTKVDKNQGRTST